MGLLGSRVDWVFPGQILGWFFLKPSPVLVLGRPVGTDFKTMIFWSKTFKKYSKNLGKPTCNLQKHKRLASKPKINPKIKKKSLWVYICFLGTSNVKKKTHNLNSSRHMKLSGTKINCFGGWNCCSNNFLFLNRNATSPSLPPPIKDWKTMKMKFGT